MCLLVIETDQLFRDNLVHHLRQRGFTVRTGEDKQSVTRALTDHSTRVALLGLEGSGRNGLDLLQHIRTVSPDTQVILMTTADNLHSSIEGMKMGAFDDVLVPCDIDLLCSKIRQAEAGSKGP